MDEKTAHPWNEDTARIGSRSKRKPLRTLTAERADNLARSIELLERRRSYNRIGGVEEDFDE